jgi:hypothetical protein
MKIGFSASFAISLCLLGCLNEVSTLDPVIRSMAPGVLVAGEPCTISGARLGQDGSASIAGLPMMTSQWRPDLINCVVPASAPGGHRLLVLHLSNGNRLHHPVEIIGQSRSNRPLDSPETMDAGVGNGPDSALPGPDGSITPNTRLRAQFSADPQSDRAVRLKRLEDTAGGLTLGVDVVNFEREAWGIAFHLDFDPNLLQFLSHPSHVAGHTFQAKVLSPGRLAIGWIRNGTEPSLVRLEFNLLGPGEGRIEIPEIHRTIRSGNNRPLDDVTWGSGSVRVTEVPR